MDSFKKVLINFRNYFDGATSGYHFSEEKYKPNYLKKRNEEIKKLEEVLPQLVKGPDPSGGKQVYLTKMGTKLRDFCDKMEGNFLKLISEKDARYIVESFE